MPIKIFFVVLLGFFISSSYAALDVYGAEDVRTSQHSISDAKNGLTVTIGLFHNKRQLKKHFGVDLSKKGILPVYIKIVNGSDSSYILLKDTASIIVTDHRRRHQKVGQSNAPTDERGNTAGDYETTLISTGPLFAALKDIKGNNGRTVGHNILAKRLKSYMLSPGEERSGFLYFEAPRAGDTPKALALNFHSLTTKRTNEFIFADIK